MLMILLLAFLTYRNSLLAKAKEQNVALWAVYTVLSFLMFAIIGVFTVIFGFCSNQIDFALLSSMDPKAQETVKAQMLAAVESNPLHAMTIFMFAFGGYLAIRYLLERIPDKKKQEVHWMDKMGK